MTIKRRLFISNILMFVLPYLLFWVLLIIFGIALFGPEIFDMSHAEREQIKEHYWQYTAAMTALPVLVIAVVNKFLTGLLIKRIMKPLNALASGVRQIGENNLGFRLAYSGKDEFRPVCDTFNEMAARLESMVKEREKNEQTRRELIAGISHDLFTPLTSIKVSIDGIKSGVAASAEQRQKYLGFIENKTAEIEHIVRQLFLFSKLDIGEFPVELQTVDCGAMIEDCVEELSGEYERRGLVLATGKLPRAIHIKIDLMLFRRVIINVFENAAKYKTAETGRLVIDCALSADEKNKTAVIRLSDDGPGVAPENLEKLFDVFYRADQSRNKKGSGLGLAISAKIIAKMGGTIHAELPDAGGLAIVIELPAAEKAACHE
jgi:signal transduction histidine kinase